MKKVIANIIIPSDVDRLPELHEIDIAWILAKHFNCEVVFLRRLQGFKRKTPDIQMMGVLWEIKSPIGKSKNTVRHQIERAVKQSKNLIIDNRRSKISDKIFNKQIQKEFDERHFIKRIIVIDKSENVLVF